MFRLASVLGPQCCHAYVSAPEARRKNCLPRPQSTKPVPPRRPRRRRPSVIVALVYKVLGSNASELVSFAQLKNSVNGRRNRLTPSVAENVRHLPCDDFLHIKSTDTPRARASSASFSGTLTVTFISPMLPPPCGVRPRLSRWCCLVEFIIYGSQNDMAITTFAERSAVKRESSLQLSSHLRFGRFYQTFTKFRSSVIGLGAA